MLRHSSGREQLGKNRAAIAVQLRTDGVPVMTATRPAADFSLRGDLRDKIHVSTSIARGVTRFNRTVRRFRLPTSKVG